MRIQQYIEWFYPGAFVAETTTCPVVARVRPEVIPEGAYAYRFYERQMTTAPDGELLTGTRRNVSGMHYLKGERLTLDNIPDTPEFRILRGNMQRNQWDAVVKCPQGYIPLFPNDSVDAA